MAEPERNEIFEVPLKVLLTDTGSTYYLGRGKKLSRYRLQDGSEQYGLGFSSIRVRDLQKMLQVGFLSKVEMTVDNVMTLRSTVTDLSKLVGYAALYRQFARDAFKEVVQSDLVLEWNRKYPKKPISRETNPADAFFRDFTSKNAEKIGAIKREILVGLWSGAEWDENLRKDEKRVQIWISERCLDAMDPAVWFLLALNRETLGFKAFVATLRTLARKYLSRAEIPEYLSLVIMELLVHLSTLKQSSSEELAGRNIPEGGTAEPSFLIWHLGSMRNLAEEHFKLRVVISNRQSEFQELKGKIEEKAALTTREKSLKVFYDENVDKYDFPDLGLYYLSYLKDACKNRGISFDSFVNQDPGTHDTLINLVLTFR